MPTTTPLTDAINALTTYANETTGAGDTDLSSAVATLVAGYGSGGGDIDGLIDGTISGDYVNTVVTKIQNQKFANCAGLTSVSFPNVTNCGASAFSKCTGLVTASLPKDAATSSYVFEYCTSLETLSVPSRSDINTNFCQGCTSLETFDCKASVIRASALKNCPSLTTIIIRHSGVCNLVSTDALGNTPFASGGSGGTIYIPKALYDNLGTGTSDYKAQARWSVIDGYGTITWKAIEGSYYETHYADGTPIE